MLSRRLRTPASSTKRQACSRLSEKRFWPVSASCRAHTQIAIRVPWKLSASWLSQGETLPRSGPCASTWCSSSLRPALGRCSLTLLRCASARGSTGMLHHLAQAIPDRVCHLVLLRRPDGRGLAAAGCDQHHPIGIHGKPCPLFGHVVGHQKVALLGGELGASGRQKLG